MHILGAILLLAFLGTVEPYKLGLKPQIEVDNQPPPPPPPSQPQPPPVQQPERLEQQTLLYPSSDYVQQEQKYEVSGIKGGLKGERELINKQPATGYLPASQPQALAYVIVRPLNYNPSTYGVTYSNGGSYPYGNEYGYNNGYNRPPYSNQRPPYNPYGQNQNPYNPYNPYSPYGPYTAQQSNLLQSGNPSLRDETQQLEEEYPTKGGVKQAPPQPDQQQQQQPPPQQAEGFDLYAEKKGKLQRLVDKIHSIFPFGSAYQINDEVPPQNPPPPPPQPQPAQPPQPERAPIQQIREQIPEQQTVHEEELPLLEPEPLREEKGHSKPFRETAAGETKRERDHLNNQQVNLSQDSDYTNAGFASSKRVSSN